MSSSIPRKTSTMQQRNPSEQGYAARTANFAPQQTFVGQPPMTQYPPSYIQAPQPQQQYQNGYTQAPQPQQRVLNTYPQDMGPNQPNTVARRNETYSTALVPVAPRNNFAAQSNNQYESNNQYASAENALVPAVNVDPEQQQLLEAVARAEKVAEEAQSDRPGSVKKSIPPFVQKLATFLNRGTDQELIRWSDKGDSFIVYDEDEFARSLIPQLFKHSNYASFVRQLNMYGFHKRVGLADNSMRSSESQKKAPSEYAHPYFRRGYDVLQWLITKPKKTEQKQQGEKRKAPGTKREETYDIDSDEEYDDAQSRANANPGTVAKTDFNRLSAQLTELKNNQQHIAQLVNGLRNSQAEIMRKALNIEMNNQRHDTSINSILSFLANVFRKSMEGRNQEFAEMLTGMLQQHANGGVMPKGSVIPTGTVQDLSDNSGQDNEEQQQQAVSDRRILSPVSRRQHLLPGIPANSPPPRSGTPHPTGYQTPTVTQAPAQEASRVTEVYETSPEDTTSPFDYRADSGTSPEETLQMLMTAHNTNAAQAAAAPAASMAHDQRRRMMHSMPEPVSAPQQTYQQTNQQTPAQSTMQNNPVSSVPAPDLARINAFHSDQTRQANTSSQSPVAGRSTAQSHQSNQANMSYQTPSPVVNNMQLPQGSTPVATDNNFQNHQQNDGTLALSNLMTSLPAPEPSILNEVSQTQDQFQQIENLQHNLNENFANLGNNPDFSTLPDNAFFGGPGDASLLDPSFQFVMPKDLEFDFSTLMNDDPNLYSDATWENNPSDPTAGLMADFDAVSPANGTTDTPSPTLTEEIVRDDLEAEMPATKRTRAAY